MALTQRESLWTFSANLAHGAAAQSAVGSNSKIPPRNREIDLSYLYFQQFDEFWKMKHIQSPETESCWMLFEKIREITSGELVFGGF